MEVINTIKDACTLIGIEEKDLNKVLNAITYSIVDAVAEARQADKSVVDLDIGLGTLHIKNDGDDILYKFIPSDDLDGHIKDAILEERNLMEDKIDVNLKKRLTSMYKDLL